MAQYISPILLETNNYNFYIISYIPQLVMNTVCGLKLLTVI
jgi:hypothetical protein